MTAISITENAMTGIITTIEDCGTLVVVWLSSGTQAKPVHFDHRPFQHMLQAENTSAADLIGRPAKFDGDILTFEE
jgi:hypothetical protein